MNKIKILITTTSFQDTPGNHHSLLKKQDWDIDYLRGPITSNILLPIIGLYDGVICGDDEYNSTVLNAGSLGKLKILSKYGVGLDKIDLETANKLNIIVTNCPGVNQISVAEHALALLLTFEKNIHLQYNSVQNLSWERLIGNEINNSLLGIIGMGSVGKELAKKAIAFGMRVHAYDINIDNDFKLKFPSIEFTSNIDDIYHKSNVISLHLPHNKVTHHMINNDVIFNKLKNHPIIINTSRGNLIDVDPLIKGLNENVIRGYLTDVLSDEPIKNSEKLVGINNVIITPHVGSRTFQSVERQGSKAINNMLNKLNQYI